MNVSLDNGGKRGCDCCALLSGIPFQLDTQGTQNAGEPRRLSLDSVCRSRGSGFVGTCTWNSMYILQVFALSHKNYWLGRKQYKGRSDLGFSGPEGPTSDSPTCLPCLPHPAVYRWSSHILPPPSWWPVSLLPLTPFSPPPLKNRTERQTFKNSFF